MEWIRWAAFEAKREAVERETARLRALWATPGNALGREVEQVLGVAVSRETSVLDLIKRPELDYAKLASVPGIGPAVDDARVAEQVEIGVKYAGYLDRQREEIERLAKDRDDELAILERGFGQRLKEILLNHTIVSGPKEIKVGSRVTQPVLAEHSARSR